MEFLRTSITHLRDLNNSDGVALDSYRLDIFNSKVTPIGEGIYIIIAFCLVLIIVKILNVIWKKKRIKRIIKPNK